MGVPGLRTFATRKLVKKHRLKNCILVIDGLSLQQDLYRQFETRFKVQHFGGDYVRFAADVEAFFQALLACGVTPVVIMDGSFPPEKLATKLKRFNAQLSTCKAIYQGRPTSGVINALLNPEMFVQILKKLNITVRTAILEADDILPTIAKDLGATLLSGDSDFLLADIPGGVISPLSLLAHGMAICVDRRNSQPYLPCKIYRFSRLLDRYPGLSTELAAIAGPIIGNDYVNGRKTAAIIRKLPEYSTVVRSFNKLETVFRWLATQTSVHSAVSYLKGIATPDHPSIRFIETHFIERSSASPATVPPKGQSVEQYFKANFNQLFFSKEPGIPQWMHKPGQLKRRLVTIFTSQVDFASPLVEDLEQPFSSYEGALELCKYIYGLLRTDDLHPKEVTLFVREGLNDDQGRVEHELMPKRKIGKDRLPMLADISNMDKNDRLNLFYRILGLSPALSFDLQKTIQHSRLSLTSSKLITELKTMYLATVYFVQHFKLDIPFEFLYALLTNILLMGNYSRRRGDPCLLKLGADEVDFLVGNLKVYNLMPSRKRYQASVVHLYNGWQIVLHNVLLLASVLNLNDDFHVDNLICGLQGTFIYKLTVDLGRMSLPMVTLKEDLGQLVFPLFEDLARLVLVNGRRQFLKFRSYAGGDCGGYGRSEGAFLPTDMPRNKMATVYEKKQGKRYFRLYEG